jgi:hypothetical protein
MVDSATYYLRITSYNMASLVTSAIFQVQSIFVKFRIWFCHLDKGHANFCHHLASAVCRNFSRLNFLSDAHYTCVSDSPTIYLRLPPLLNIKNSFIDKYCTILIQNVLNLEHTFWLSLSYLPTLFDKGKTQETYQSLLPNWFEPMVSKKTMSDSYYGFFISFICMFDIHHLKEMFQGKNRRNVKLLVCSKFSTFWIKIVQYLSINEFFIFKSA